YARVDFPSWRIEHGLWIRAVIDQPHDRLQMRLRLDETAHDAEAAVGLPVPGDKTRNDGVIRPLAAVDDIRVAILQRKAGAAVLKADAGARDDDAGSKSHVIRLNERHHH